MNKLKTRRQFVKQTIENPEQSVKELRQVANDFNKCVNTVEKVHLLSKLLHIHPSTIWRDYTKD